MDSSHSKKRKQEESNSTFGSTTSTSTPSTARRFIQGTTNTNANVNASISTSTFVPTADQVSFAKRLEDTYIRCCIEANETLKEAILSQDVVVVHSNSNTPKFVYRGFIDEFFRAIHLADHRYGCETGNLMGSGLNDSRALGRVENVKHQPGVHYLHFVNSPLEDKRIRQVSAGSMFAVALSIYGVAYSWGMSDKGCLGRTMSAAQQARVYHEDDDDDTKSAWESTPAPVKGLPNIMQVAAGNAHCLFLSEDGQVFMCGSYKDDGDVHFRDPQESTSKIDGVYNEIPVLVPFPKPVVQIFTGQSANFNFALLEDGTLHSWGFGNSGELARTKEMGLQKKNGHYHTRSDVYSHEDNGERVIDRQVALKFLIPAPVPLPSKHVLSVACGSNFTLVVARNPQGKGEVFVSGANNYGQHGNGRATSLNDQAKDPTLEVEYHELRKIEALAHEDMAKVAAGDFHCLALTLDGARPYAWGRSDKGQLGLGRELDWKVDNVATPTIVVFLDRTTRCIIKDIQCGASHSMALSYEGDVYTWGYTDGNDIMATGHETEESLDIYYPTKLEMRVGGGKQNPNKTKKRMVGKQCMEAIKMAGAAQSSLFLVQDRADDDDDWTNGGGGDNADGSS